MNWDQINGDPFQNLFSFVNCFNEIVFEGSSFLFFIKLFIAADRLDFFEQLCVPK